jgi:hypothetical protein
MTVYQNYLTIQHRHKPIPYGGDGLIREDGEANYGFRYVKGNTSELLKIPELAKDSSLYELAKHINELHTGLFTVGCVSGQVADQNGYRNSGYIEFAINSKSTAADATSYFPIFFHFDRSLAENKIALKVAYNWELQPAVFTESENACAYTCCVTINTHYSLSRETANQVWTEALSMLGEYLATVPIMAEDFIYPQ